MEGLRALGYREGDNLSLEARHADYSESQVGRMAAEIAALKPAVIVAFGGGIVPAIRLSPPIPVVFLHSGDPVDGGFAESLARPGDLPIELPTVVELVVNRRTAAAMNLVLPPAILSRADRVVDSQAAT